MSMLCVKELCVREKVMGARRAAAAAGGRQSGKG